MITGRLVSLREVEESDMDLLREWRNLREVYYNLFTWIHITSEMQRKWYEVNKANGNVNDYFIIEYKNSPVGLIYMSSFHQTHKHAYFGFYIPRETDRKPGIAMEAEYLFIDYLFRELAVNKVVCEVFTFNEPVIQMHKHFGFKVEGTLRSHIYHDGTFKDVAILGLLQGEFEASAPKINRLIERVSGQK